MKSGIYIHIPFCATRCHYCNFATGGYDETTASRYVSALKHEIQQFTNNPNFDQAGLKVADTIYFGGGTPTTLSTEQISGIIETVRNNFNISSDAEITTEANPGSVSTDYLKQLRKAGVNRLSYGVQSFDDSELQMISRTHSSQEARDAVKQSRDAGFDNVSIDLIAGLPEQQFEVWLNNLNEAFGLNPDHLSVYLLELYKDAPLQHRIERGELRAIDEETTVRMYYELVDRAEQSGFTHYEISNWAKPGKESRHNLKYWIGAPYSAFGISAAGFDGRKRWSNTRNIHEYLKLLEGGGSPITETIVLSDDEIQSDSLFLHLRLKNGVDLKRHQRTFGVNVIERYKQEIERLSQAELIELHNDTLTISRKGLVLANEVFASFV